MASSKHLKMFTRNGDSVVNLQNIKSFTINRQGEIDFWPSSTIHPPTIHSMEEFILLNWFMTSFARRRRRRRRKRWRMRKCDVQFNWTNNCTNSHVKCIFIVCGLVQSTLHPGCLVGCSIVCSSVSRPSVGQEEFIIDGEEKEQEGERWLLSSSINSNPLKG